MSERSELFSLPDLYLPTPGTPKGLRPSGRLLLLTFLCKARKVSGCLAASGKPQLTGERKDSATEERTKKSSQSCSSLTHNNKTNQKNLPIRPTTASRTDPLVIKECAT